MSSVIETIVSITKRRRNGYSPTQVTLGKSIRHVRWGDSLTDLILAKQQIDKYLDVEIGRLTKRQKLQAGFPAYRSAAPRILAAGSSWRITGARKSALDNRLTHMRT